MNPLQDSSLLILRCPDCGHPLRLHRKHIGIIGNCVACRAQIMGREVFPGEVQAVRAQDDVAAAPKGPSKPLPSSSASSDIWGFQQALGPEQPNHHQSAHSIQPIASLKSGTEEEKRKEHSSVHKFPIPPQIPHSHQCQESRPIAAPPAEATAAPATSDLFSPPPAKPPADNELTMCATRTSQATTSLTSPSLTSPPAPLDFLAEPVKDNRAVINPPSPAGILASQSPNPFAASVKSSRHSSKQPDTEMEMTLILPPISAKTANATTDPCARPKEGLSTVTEEGKTAEPSLFGSDSLTTQPAHSFSAPPPRSSLFATGSASPLPGGKSQTNLESSATLAPLETEASFAKSFMDPAEPVESEKQSPCVHSPLPALAGASKIESVRLKPIHAKKAGLGPAATWAVVLGTCALAGFVACFFFQDRREAWQQKINDFLAPGSVVLEQLPFGGKKTDRLPHSPQPEEFQAPESSAEANP